ncbi:MAG TPA: hypothetical protein VHS09_11870 [Polyangiaceae bacterium]|jgi:hypothetical protein|nr:hypothetical protein [Polyangiaceae bacterium]
MRPRTLALGTWLAARGPLAALGFALAIGGALASVVAAVALSGTAVAARLPLVESSAIAWTAGLILAFGGGLRALRHDRDQGVTALARARGATRSGYVRGRVAGLVLVLAVALGGAILVAGVAATSVARPPLPAVQTSAAALAYVLAFAATLGPVAMASLGSRTRSGGLLTLLAIVALPELLVPWTSSLLPHGWHELTSIPAALAAVRAGVAAPAAMALPMVRAVVGLAAVVALSLLFIAARVRRADSHGAAT